MSMGCISGTQLLLMDRQDRMSNQVAGTQRMVEHVVEYKRRSGELTSTRRLADCLPPQVQRQGEVEPSVIPRADPIDNGPRQFESDNVTAESQFGSVYEPTVRGRVNIASLRSETHQVRSPICASLKVSRSGPLQCLKNCSCRMSLSIRHSFPKILLQLFGGFLLQDF